MKKGVSRIPLDMARLKDEDLVVSPKLMRSSSSTSNISVSTEDNMDFYAASQQRNDCYNLKSIP